MWAIRGGSDCPARKTIAIQGLNQLASIRSVRGDYNQTELADDERIRGFHRDAILRHCPDAAMIVFAAGVKHAATPRGKTHRSGYSRQGRQERTNETTVKRRIQTSREGRINCLVTVQVHRRWDFANQTSSVVRPSDTFQSSSGRRLSESGAPHTTLTGSRRTPLRPRSDWRCP